MLEGEDYQPSRSGTLLWMVAIATVLFWVPAFNGLIAGLVGGHRAEKWTRALPLAVVAVALVGLIFLLGSSIASTSWSYLTYGIPPLAYLAMTGGGLLLGALLGALIERDPLMHLSRRRRVHA